jgi:hypothetical protein
LGLVVTLSHATRARAPTFALRGQLDRKVMDHGGRRKDHRRIRTYPPPSSSAAASARQARDPIGAARRCGHDLEPLAPGNWTWSYTCGGSNTNAVATLSIDSRLHNNPGFEY